MTNRRRFLEASTAAVAGLALAGAGSRSARADARKYKACVIGSTGRGDYGHGMELCFAHRPDVAVVAVADPDERGGAKAAAACGAERRYSDYREMLERERPDFVSIGPRHTTDRVATIRAAAEVGAHVYMEKPVAASPAECDAMIAALEAGGSRCAVAHQMRLAPAVRELERIAASGELGDLVEMRGYGKEDRRSGGEDLIVLGVHVFDLMLRFAGAAPERCAAKITVARRDILPTDAREATEPVGLVAGDCVRASYVFPGEAAGYFASRPTPEGRGGGRFGLRLYFQNGAAAIALGGDLDVRILRGESRWIPMNADGPKWETLPGFDSPDDPRRGAKYLNALAADDLIAAVEEGREPALSIRSALAGLEMVVACYESALGGGVPVAFPLARREHPLAGARVS